VDPYSPDGEIPMVEHAAPLLAFGTVMVPVMPPGTGVTVGDAPTCKPFAPTDAPETIPSEEVAPSEGMAVPTWANAVLQQSRGHAVATMNNGLMTDSPITAGRPQAPRVSQVAEAMTFFFTAALDYS
jgi:hypothetical protein